MTNEKVILKQGNVFHYSGISTLGPHSLYITTMGRMLAHDKGGMFGSEEIIEYDINKNKVNINIVENQIRIKNANNSHRLRFEFLLEVDEFIKFSNSVPSSSFEFVEGKTALIKFENEHNSTTNRINATSGNIITLISSLMQPNGLSSAYFQATIDINVEGITLTNGTGTNTTIPYSRIRTIEIIDKLILKIQGIFHHNGDVFSEFYLFYPIKDRMKDMLLHYKNSEKLYDVFQDIETIHVGNIYDQEKEKEISVIITHTHFNIYNEKQKKLVNSFEKNSILIYKRDRIIAIGNQDNMLIINLEADYSVKYFEFMGESTYFLECIQVNGSIKGKKYKSTNFVVISKGKLLLFNKQEGFQIQEVIDLHDYSIVIDKNKLILYNTEIAMLVFPNEVSKMVEDGLTIGDTMNILLENQMPYHLRIGERSLFFHSRLDYEPEKEYLYSSVKHMKMINVNETSNFCMAEVCLLSGEKVLVEMDQSTYSGIVYHIYKVNKSLLLPSVKTEQMFLSYSRLNNDFILFQVFAQLIALKEGIKQIQYEEDDRDIRNEKLVNFLYHGLQSQKKRLDAVIVYLPKLLEQEELSTLSMLRLSRLKEFKRLQDALMSISGQMSRTIAEIESSISAVTYILIEKHDFDSLIDKRTMRGYGIAGALGVVGAFFPPLLIGAALTGANSYFSKKDHQEQEEIRLINEKNRLDFYVQKMLDRFDHFFVTWFPYYISEVNEAVYECYSQLSSRYSEVLELPVVKEKLLHNISTLYTFKQLPIDDSVNNLKDELIEVIHNYVSVGNENIKNLNLEVHYHVSKYIETTRLGEK